MKIVFQHDHPLPVKKYGGIERLLFWHMKELASMGHQVVLIGHRDSEVSYYGIELIPMEEKEWRHLIPKDSDIIHLSYNHIVPGDIPTVVTLHGNGQPGELFPLNTVFLSEKHAKNHGGEVFIYNALDLSEYPYEERSRSWNKFLFLAKASWKVKNLKHCLKAVKGTDKQLNVIGGSSFLPKRNTTFHGFLDGEQKRNVMKSCDALLMPVRWHEPFGLAAIESMAFGLPVVASTFGSLPELVNEDTGILVRSFDELRATVLSAKRTFNSKTIRTYVEDRFNFRTYSQKYIEVYERVIAGDKLHQEQPRWQFDRAPQELLDF